MNTVTAPEYLPEKPELPELPTGRHFRAQKFDFWSFFFSGLTGLATLLILGILAVILVNIIINGWTGFSWHFVSTIPKKDFFDVHTTGVLPMIVGTTFRVLVMTIFVIPIGVITWLACHPLSLACSASASSLISSAKTWTACCTIPAPSGASPP